MKLKENNLIDILTNLNNNYHLPIVKELEFIEGLNSKNPIIDGKYKKGKITIYDGHCLESAKLARQSIILNKDDLYNYYLIRLLLHEYRHAYQEYILLDNKESILKNLLNIERSYNFNSFYNEYHDFFISEHDADTYSLIKIDLCNKDLFNLDEILLNKLIIFNKLTYINLILRRYKNLSPIENLFNLINIDVNKILTFNDIEFYDRINFGLPISNTEYKLLEEYKKKIKSKMKGF